MQHNSHCIYNVHVQCMYTCTCIYACTCTLYIRMYMYSQVHLSLYILTPKTDTTDLQSAEVVFFENNIFLRCFFANNSQALGCVIRLSISSTNDTESDDTFELRRQPGINNDIVISNCNSTTNRRVAYSEIVGVDLEGDGMVGDVSLQVAVIEVENESNFTQLTNCTLAQQGMCVHQYIIHNYGTCANACTCKLPY